MYWFVRPNANSLKRQDECDRRGGESERRENVLKMWRRGGRGGGSFGDIRLCRSR